MKKFLIIFLSLIILPLEVFAVSMPKVTEQKQIEMQTHYFDTTDSERVLKAAIETLQNSDFIIQDMNTDYGYIAKRIKITMLIKKEL